MYTLKYCQLCLVVTGARTFPMNTATFEAYVKLLRLPLHNKEPYICYECSALLLKYQEFCAKCLRAHNVLTQFKMQSAEVITCNVFEAQRKLHNLQSKLSLSAVSQEHVQLQHDYGDEMDNDRIDIVLENSEHDEDSKLNILHVKCEHPDPDNVVKNSACCVIDRNSNNKKFMTKCEDFGDDEPLINGSTNTLAKITMKRSKKCINSGVNNKYTRHTNKLLKNSPKRAKTLKPKQDIAMKEEINEFTDSSSSDIDEELLTDIGNSKELVDQATEIAKCVLLEKGIVSEEEFHTTIVDLHDDEALLSIKNSEELVKKAIKIVHKLRSKRKKFDASFFEGYATVVPLTREAARNEILLRKETSNYLNSAYKCELCYRGYTGEITYDNHMKKHSQEYGSIECVYCHIRFPNKRLRYKHIAHFHTMKIICKICNYETCGTYQGKNHIAMHKGKKYPCDKCDAVYRQQNTLLAHKRQMHATECVCELCGNTFGTRHGLYTHKNLAHKQEILELTGPYCVDCDMQFATESAFKRHLVRSDKHKGAVSNGCEFCGKTFSDELTLKDHIIQDHTRRKPGYCCAHCPSRYWDRTAFKRHMTSQHPLTKLPKMLEAGKGEKAGGKGYKVGKKADRASRRHNTFVETYICEYCGKNLDKLQMRYHKLKHTGERPYKCKECGKGFSHPSSLYLHKGTHATTRQYQCDKCPKNYKTKGVLQKHLRTHTGIRPYKCDLCGKNFLHPCDLKTHVKYTHDKVPWPPRQRKRQKCDQPPAEQDTADDT